MSERTSDIIYFSSPYSHKEQGIVEERFKKTCAMVAKLTAEGNVVISSIAYGHVLLWFQEMQNDWDFWKNFCLSFLIRAKKMIIYTLPGWELSTGIKGEIEFCKAHGIEVIYLEEDTSLPYEMKMTQ